MKFNTNSELLRDTDFLIRIHGDNKLGSLICFPIDRPTQIQVFENLDAVELKHSRSVSNSLG